MIFNINSHKYTFLIISFLLIFLCGCKTTEKVDSIVTKSGIEIYKNRQLYSVLEKETIDKNVDIKGKFCPISSGYVYADNRNEVICTKIGEESEVIYSVDDTFKILTVSANADDMISLFLKNDRLGQCYITVITVDGQEVLSVELGNDLYSEHIESVGYYDDKLYVFFDKGIYCIDDNDIRKYLYKKDEGGYWKTFNGSEIVLYGDKNGTSMTLSLDLKTLSVNEQHIFNDYMNWLPGINNVFYSSDDNMVIHFDNRTDEVAALYSDIGIDPSTIRMIASFNNSNIIIVSEEKDNMLTILSPVLQETTETDDRVSLHFLGVNPSLYSPFASSYNNNNASFRIEMLPAVSLDKYYLDIATGDSDLFELFGTRYEAFARKGYLYDITGRLENSNLIDENEFIDRIYSDFMVDGKIYALPKTMNLQTLCVPEDSLAGRKSWTVDEFLNYMEENPTALSDENGKTVADIKADIVWCAINVEDLINSDGYLNTSRLKEILQKVNSIDVTVDLKSVERKLKDGEAAIVSLPISTPLDFSDYQTKIGRKLVPIGYPAANGDISKGNIIYSNLVGISPKTKYPDAAWNFSELYISKEIVPKSNEVLTTKDGFEQAMNEGIDREKFKFNGVDYYPVSKEEIETVKEAYYNAGLFTVFKSDLSDIIWEEVQYYFRGEKSVDEVVKVVESRTRLMIDEQKP